MLSTTRQENKESGEGYEVLAFGGFMANPIMISGLRSTGGEGAIQEKQKKSDLHAKKKRKKKRNGGK